MQCPKCSKSVIKDETSIRCECGFSIEAINNQLLQKVYDEYNSSAKSVKGSIVQSKDRSEDSDVDRHSGSELPRKTSNPDDKGEESDSSDPIPSPRVNLL